MCFQILILKCEGYKFPRNPNAHTLELFCSTHFYGPLVVAMNRVKPPHRLVSFIADKLLLIDEMNKKEEKSYPSPFTPAAVVGPRTQRFSSSKIPHNA